MTQVSTRELAFVVCPPDLQPAAETIPLVIAEGLLIGVVFAIGLATGLFWQKFRS